MTQLTDKVSSIFYTIKEKHDTEELDVFRNWATRYAMNVNVRSRWARVGEELKPCEYRIILETGGPMIAVEGYLSTDGRPVSAKLLGLWAGERDVKREVEGDALIDFARAFIFE